MNTTKVRSELKQCIDKLSPEKLILVADFVQDLETEENVDVTEELLNIPDFKSAFEKGNQEVKEGKIKDWRDIRNHDIFCRN